MEQIYLSDKEAKTQILEFGRRMYEKGFVAANDGNISCRVAPDVIWTTPTGVSKGYMTEQMLVKMTLDGQILSGTEKPSSEVKMHIRAYRESPEIMGVCHAHPPVSTSFAIAGLGLNSAIYPEALVNLGTVPCVHYEAPGSQGIPDSIAPYVKSHNAVLLANHGAVTWGSTLTQAYFRLEALEHYAMILMNTGYILKQARVLSEDQIRTLVGIRDSQGIFSGGIPKGAPEATNLQDSL